MSMVCKYSEKTYDEEDTRFAVILSDTTPDEFPTTGENVDNLPDSVKLDSGSIMLILDPAERHMLGNDGTWHKVG